ncbi:GatB/YqeY domain-containing protein [Alsobacter sp. R-9]
MRDEFTAALKDAMRAGDKRRVSTIRLITSALKDRDIEARGAGKDPLSDDEILGLLQKMVKQRQESLKIYEENAREDLATQEREEIAIIMGFMPQQMDEAQVSAAIDAAIAATGAAGMKDMGKVMAALKEKFSGRMDFGKASAAIKAKLAG